MPVAGDDAHPDRTRHLAVRLGAEAQVAALLPEILDVDAQLGPVHHLPGQRRIALPLKDGLVEEVPQQRNLRRRQLANLKRRRIGVVQRIHMGAAAPQRVQLPQADLRGAIDVFLRQRLRQEEGLAPVIRRELLRHVPEKRRCVRRQQRMPREIAGQSQGLQAVPSEEDRVQQPVVVVQALHLLRRRGAPAAIVVDELPVDHVLRQVQIAAQAEIVRAHPAAVRPAEALEVVVPAAVRRFRVEVARPTGGVHQHAAQPQQIGPGNSVQQSPGDGEMHHAGSHKVPPL